MDVLKALWNDKPVLIAVLGGAALLIWFVLKNGPGPAQGTSQPQQSFFPNLGTYPEGQIVVNPTPVNVINPPQIFHIRGQGIFDQQQIQQPTGNPLSGITQSYGLLGPNTQILKNTSGQWKFFTTSDTRAQDLKQYLAAQGLSVGEIRQGSQGRWWDIVGNLKYLITAGQGGEITNPYGTDANKYCVNDVC